MRKLRLPHLAADDKAGTVKTGTLVTQSATAAADGQLVTGESQIRTPQELAARLVQLQARAHVLSPFAGVASIPPHIAITPVVVVIDPTIDADTGRGSDVYHQSSIHKTRKQGTEWVPLEVSLNKNGLLKIMRAAGVSITESKRTDDGSRPYYWSWSTSGRVRDFDGSWMDLAPGDVEIDAEDGSAQIGEWTEEAWARSEAEAAEKRRTQKLGPGDAWKVKPEAIGGFTAERVRGIRRFGLRLAQSKSLTAFARGLGVKSVYSIAELQAKPFVLLRATFMPDMTDPDVRRMVTASQLGSTQLLYPGATPPANLTTPAAALQAAALTDTVPVAVLEELGGAPADAETLTTFPGDEPLPPEAGSPTYRIADARKQGERYFFVTTDGKTFTTTDPKLARVLFDAKDPKTPLDIDDEVVELAGVRYLNVVSVSLALPARGGL